MMAADTPESTLNILQTVVDSINAKFGYDTQSLSEAGQLYDKYVDTKTSLSQQLTSASTKAPSRIDTAVSDAEDIKQRIHKFGDEKHDVCGEIANFMADVNPMVKKLSTLTDQVQELERYSLYVQMLGKIEDYSSDIQSALIISSTDRAVTSFSMLAHLTKTIQGSNCSHLVRFANETVVFWYKILKEKITVEFDEVLAAYRWPFIVSTSKTQPIQNANEIRAKLDPLFVNLLHLQLPQGLSVEGQPNTALLAGLPGWRPLPLPLELMVKPLRKRFRYHFYGKKQTNSIDKPEWYLTQVLTWIRDHHEFLSTRIQPLLEKAGLQSVDAVTEFSRGLVVLAIEKVLCDIPETLYDEHIFSHLVDEALAFDRELRTTYNYPASQPGILAVLTQSEPFNKWILVETKFARERVDAMLASETAWQSQYKDMSDVDETKVPECGESFMTLMLTITDRYKPLPVVSCRLRFLELQLEMLDDYRVRLLQVKAEENNNPLGHVFTAIINTVAYIVSVLREWSELLFFLQLQHYKVEEQQARLQAATSASASASASDKATVIKNQSSLSSPVVRDESLNSQASFKSVDEVSLSALEGCVFDEIIQLLDHMQNDMLHNIVRYVTDDIIARSRPYRKDKWISLPSQRDFVSLTLSPSACDLLLVLKDRLQLLQQVLAKDLLTSAWQMIASNLDTFIYEEVILTNHFNEGGASQLKYDMTRNLFPLFGQYTHRPDSYFKRTREACLLLTLNVGSGLLLKDVLYRALHDCNSDPRDAPQDPIAALHDLNIQNLSPDDAELVLSLRTDFCT